MEKEKRDMSLKYGVALALSLGGILYSLLLHKRVKYPPASGTGSWVSGSHHRPSHTGTAPTSLHFHPLATNKQHEELPVPHLSPSNQSNDAYLLPEDIEDFNTPNVSPMEDSQLLRPADIDSHAEKDPKSLGNLVKVLKQNQLLAQKEKETAAMELQSRLNMEAKLFAPKINADNRRILEAQMADYLIVVAELEAATAKIKVLKKKLRSEAERNKKHILDLQQRVHKMQQHEHKHVAAPDQEIQSSLQKQKSLEAEVEELRKTNGSLRLEKADLAGRLDCFQILGLEDGETEKLKGENQKLKKQNKDLWKEIERLQADRYGDVEELVYLRWINACLRYELRNYEVGPGKTMAKDLSRTLSPRSEEKAKQLILEYANSMAVEDSNSVIMDMDSGSGIKDPSHKNKSSNKLFGKLVEVLRGKDRRNSSTTRLRTSSSQRLTYRHSDAGQRWL